MSAIPKREYQEVVTDLTGKWRAGEERRGQARIWPRALAKYQQRYPEAVRSLMEDWAVMQDIRLPKIPVG